MKELLSNVAYSPNEFLELLEPGFEYHVRSWGRVRPSSTNSGQQNSKSLSEPLQNKFSEWNKKLEDVQKHCPEWQKLPLAKKVMSLRMILDHVYKIFTTITLDGGLERDLAELVEVLIHSHAKIEQCQPLSEEDLQLLSDFETMISEETWQHVLNNTSEVVGDSKINNDAHGAIQLSLNQNHHTTENLQNSLPVEDMETLETLLDNLSIGQQEELHKSSEIPQNTLPETKEIPQKAVPVAEGEVRGTFQQDCNKKPQNEDKTVSASHSRPTKRKSDVKTCGNSPPKVAALTKSSPARKKKKDVRNTPYNNRRKEAEVIDLVSSDEEDEKAKQSVPEPKNDQRRKVKTVPLRRSPRFSDRREG